MRLTGLLARVPPGVRRGLLLQLVLHAVAGLAGALAVAAVALPGLVAPGDVAGPGLLAGLGVAAAVAGRIVATVAAGRVGMPAAFALTTGLRRMLLRHVVDVPLGTFSRWSSARLGLVATDQVRKVEIAVSFAAGELAACAGTAAALVALAAVLSVPVGLAAVAGVALHAATSLWSDRLIGGALAQLAPATTDAARRIEEHVQGLATIRAQGARASREAALATAVGRVRDILTAQSLMVSGAVRSGAVVTDVAVILGVALALASAADVPGGAAPGGLALVACAGVLALGANRALARASAYLAFLRLGEGAAREVDAFLAEPVLPRAAPAATPERFDITFRDVALTYEGRDATALSGLSFAAPAGRVTAIVGPSGAGKSSILGLVARHRDPVAGTVEIGGVDIRRIPPDDLARLVTFVEQEPFLFDRSLAENVRLGRPGATDAELEALARDVGLDEVVANLAAGWDTVVGEAGGTLSGGERQRVAIARAVLAEAPIVLLDEATSSLDADTEALVRRALARRFAGRTVLIVTHRLSIAAAADRIVVVDDGRVVGTGTHAELVAAGGVYARFWAAEQRAAAWRLSTAAGDGEATPAAT
ncbi:ABC transporter ATP-binding protein [Rhodoplanes sp. TEM]|uniref:ABC transporter ATP-binding protein n=1 Tax=Rhodoplanes tepidamans TaxID=200616 RepID=A0ABT5JEU1_RHOTP|nr:MULTISPECIES: ABC transporter ATP-binding protein [Rhodoplanes]MDC7788203.1 ABC transporter ATP-binding protein [Rhodoplanes tepidamans]MDC7983545.1 ABC transporter ATP-binding protein [Rhodoplanes sp. TEM]MDQ0354213.1 ATP-binding cassette subfamily B protein [Rhodoplanes tepidamans]